MKIIRFLFCAAIAALVSVPLAFTGCKSAPSERVVEAQSLKAVGQAADAAVALSAQLYRDSRITAAQARQVDDFYDKKFQPVFRVAVSAVQANLDSIASPDVMALAAQLSALVSSFQHPAP